MKPLVIALPGNEGMAERIAAGVGAENAKIETRAFPDGETYVRFLTSLTGRKVALVCTLDHPNEKFLALLFAASTARELGAAQIGLVAPYLAYMRQDRRFHSGEALTSDIFAHSLSTSFDWLIAVDPHLHRRHALSEIYEIPTRVVHAAPLFAPWIVRNVEHPLLIGPDEESEQWVGSIARACGAPHLTLKKERKGDREVEISFPKIADLADKTPVLVDDIISSGHTIIRTVEQLQGAGVRNIVCMAIHGIFAEGAYERLLQSGIGKIVTTNSISHPSNAIDVSGIISEGSGTLFA